MKFKKYYIIFLIICLPYIVSSQYGDVITSQFCNNNSAKIRINLISIEPTWDNPPFIAELENTSTGQELDVSINSIEGNYIVGLVQNLQAGNYEATIFVAERCFLKLNFEIKTPIIITATSGTICQDGYGTITSTISGGTAPYTFLWSNGATTQDISGLDLGTYSVTVTDSGGCSKEESVEVLDKNIKAITFDDGFTQPVCNGSSTVIKIASVEGFLATGNTLGTLNQYFTFFWSNGATTSFINVTKVCKPYSLWHNYCPDYQRIIEIT